MAAVAIVGAGPRGAGLLERLAASASEFGTGLDVHLIDPYPAGAGRIWRHDQSPLLAMNSMAADVTMFTDDTVVCDGPIRPGPSMWEWACSGPEVDPELRDELAALTAATFPSRRLQCAYLTWVLHHVIAGLPPAVRVHLHATTATALTEDGPDQLVTLADGTALRVDAVVLASGHLDADPTPDELALVADAAAAGLTYLPPEQTTDSDLSVIPPGADVLARGTGLAFVDLVVLLFEGRGGRYEQDGDGLRYVPSGREPTVHVGSPRGALYHAKTGYQLRAGRPPLPRFLGPDAVDPLIALGDVDLRRDVWPLMAREIGWGWYHELVRGHPERVSMTWDAFAAAYADDPDAAVRAAVPDPLDRLDLAALDRPLDGLDAPDLDALQPLVRAVIAEDLRRHVDERHTAHLGAFVAMLSVYGEVGRLGGALTPESRARDLPAWQSLFNAVASGPPGFRVREILALIDAGYLRFLGPGTTFAMDGDAFVARGTATPDAVRARVLVDARLPDPSLTRTRDPLLAGLHRDGEVAEETLVAADGTVLRTTGLLLTRPADGAVVRGDGSVHPRRFAVGPHTSVKVAGAFTRPGMNAQSLRYNDAVARAVLAAVAPRAARERAA